MDYRIEPPYDHGTPARTGVLVVNLGSPQAPTAAATRRYLAQFLSDPRVVEIPRWAWWPILHGIILRIRPSKSAAKYATIWTEAGSPLVSLTQRLVQRVQDSLLQAQSSVVVEFGMRYGTPSIGGALDRLRQAGAQRILVLPLYPQYAAATTASAWDAVAQWVSQARFVPEMRFVNHYHDHPTYIAKLAESVRQHWRSHGRGELLVMTFHGLPQRSLLLGDPYHCECYKTARLLGQALELPPTAYRVTFQSRFGRAQWLRPYTEPTLRELAAQGLRRVDVVCPGFSVDCLETLEEIAQEARDAFLESGGQEFHYIPCLNDSQAAGDLVLQLIQDHTTGWPPGTPMTTHELAQQKLQAQSMGAQR